MPEGVHGIIVSIHSYEIGAAFPAAFVHAAGFQRAWIENPILAFERLVEMTQCQVIDVLLQ